LAAGPGPGWQPWEDLDFLGWRDPQSPERAYLAAEIDGRLVAIVLRCPGPSPLQKKTSMCSICLTSHSGGVTLMVAPRTDLACSLYLRGKKAVRGLGGRPAERLTPEEQTERMMANLTAFIVKVTG
jgi:hypothetical protein